MERGMKRRCGIGGGKKIGRRERERNKRRGREEKRGGREEEYRGREWLKKRKRL